jgi:hypothetical protein
MADGGGDRRGWLFAGEYQMVMRGNVPSAAPAAGKGAM